MINGHLIKNVFKSIQWNAIESFGYQLLFLLHQTALFNAVDRSFYGIIGSTFSYIYLVAFIAHLGFDGSLARSLTSWQSNRTALAKNVSLHIAASAALGVFSFAIIYSTGFATALTSFLISSSMVIEAIRKMLRSILHLTFNNKLTMKSELFFITLYCLLVWTPILIFHCPITIVGIIAPLLIASLLTSAFLAKEIIFQYATAHGTCPKPYRLVYQERMAPGLYQLSTIFFTGNFLVLFFGRLFGMSCAGNAKFMVTIIYTLTAVIHKIFDASSSALFAHLGNDQNKQPYFATISTLLYHSIAAALTILLICSPLLINDSAQQITLAFFFSAMSILELIIIPYEKLYIIENKAYYLVITNSIASLGFIALIINQPASLAATTLFLIILRVIALLIATKLAHSLWHLTDYHKTLSSYLIGAVGTAAIIFFLLG